MRYRALSPTGDYLFGASAYFLVNSPATVAQAIKTRLNLLAGEWFLDNRVGLNTDLILGRNTAGTRDREVQKRILGTTGVTGIASYQSTLDGRDFNVVAIVDTVYGDQVTINETF
jgi:hypothetical protein